MLLPTYQSLREQLLTVLYNKQEQGHIVIGLAETLASLPDSYDALATFAQSLADLPQEVDWPFDEPNALDAIWESCDPERPLGALARDRRGGERAARGGGLPRLCLRLYARQAGGGQPDARRTARRPAAHGRLAAR